MGLILGLLTVAGFLLNYVPKLSIDTSGSLRPNDPMGNVLQLSNDGPLPVHDIYTLCGIDRIENRFGGGFSGLGSIHFPDSDAVILSPGHKMTLPCAHAVASYGGAADAILTAQVVITVDYRPDWVWWHKHIEFPLEAERTQDGKWIWKHLAN